MVVNVANSVHRNLKIIALNTSILNFFAEITNFLLTIKIVQRNKTASILQKLRDNQLPGTFQKISHGECKAPNYFTGVLLHPVAPYYMNKYTS